VMHDMRQLLVQSGLNGAGQAVGLYNLGHRQRAAGLHLPSGARAEVGGRAGLATGAVGGTCCGCMLFGMPG
jgi:hypothetical protein